jgi:hypothetical protein
MRRSKQHERGRRPGSLRKSTRNGPALRGRFLKACAGVAYAGHDILGARRRSFSISSPPQPSTLSASVSGSQELHWRRRGAPPLSNVCNHRPPDNSPTGSPMRENRFVTDSNFVLEHISKPSALMSDRINGYAKAISSRCIMGDPPAFVARGAA